MATSDGLRLDVRADGVAVLTMCRGENKFDPEFVQSWHTVLDQIESRDDITALITTAQGRFFSSGLNLQWLKRSSPQQTDNYHEHLHRLYTRIISLCIPTVAAVNGHAIAEGAFIALTHDVMIMNRERGWLQWPEVHLKLPMTSSMLDILRVKMPSHVAIREAIIFGKRLSADRAQTLGIVDVATMDDALMKEALTAIKNAHGNSALRRSALSAMKTDLYASQIKEEIFTGKL